MSDATIPKGPCPPPDEFETWLDAALNYVHLYIEAPDRHVYDHANAELETMLREIDTLSAAVAWTWSLFGLMMQEVNEQKTLSVGTLRQAAEMSRSDPQGIISSSMGWVEEKIGAAVAEKDQLLSEAQKLLQDVFDGCEDYEANDWDAKYGAWLDKYRALAQPEGGTT